MTSIVLHGCYDTRNYGDLLIVDMLARYIAGRTGMMPVLPWSHPEERGSPYIRYGHGMADCELASVGIFGGGGYLESSGSAGDKRLERYSNVARMWSKASIPYVMVGVGVGPRLTRAGNRQIQEICDGASAVAVRDEESLEILRTIYRDHDKLHLSGDIVYLLNHTDIPRQATEEARLLLGPRQRQFRVGLHLSFGRSLKGLYGQVLRVFSEAAKSCDIEVVWIEDSPSREALHTSLRHGMLEGGRYIPYQSRWITAALIQSFDAVFTTKLHVGITAWSLGVPAFGMSLHPKVGRFYRQIGRKECHFNLSNVPGKADRFRRGLIQLGIVPSPTLSEKQLEMIREWISKVTQQSPSYADLAERQNDQRAQLREQTEINLRLIDDHVLSRLI